MSKTVFITGCSTGIGKATAELFADRGWNVAATMRNPADGTSLSALKNVRVYALDVTDEAAGAQTIAQVINDFGTLDVLVNNAGYGLFGPFEMASVEKVQQQFATNVFGVMATIRHALPTMRAQQSGVIINITSIGGLVTLPFNSIYHATKFAIDGFSEGLVYELEPMGIQVKIVAPGGVATDFAGRSLVVTAEKADNPYAPLVQKVMSAFSSRSENGYSTPQYIAETIYGAATDGTNQLRYVVGDDAKRMIEARTQLNQADYFTMITNNFGLK